MDDVIAWYTLAKAQVGARATMRLLEAFQHPTAILAASVRAWAAQAQLSPAACTRLQQVAARDLSAELARLERIGVRLISLYDADYPPLLRAIADPPCVLFVKGTLPPTDAPALAIVGSRRASPYGRHVAAELAAELAHRGVAIISGMALGADAAAHEGCLRAGGKTVAVLGCGIDVIYPPEHADLYERIAAAGAVVSEMPPGAPPGRMTFPVRNRIISGLSLGTVVVEAPEKSGALITADHALEQGRDVFAVPGSVNSVQSRGTHQLLRNGAKLVASVEDILEELPRPAPALRRASTALAGPSWDLDIVPEELPPPPPAPAPTPRKAPSTTTRAATPVPPPVPPLPPEEAAVIALLSAEGKHIDALIAAVALSPAQVNAALLMLELKGLVQRQPGNIYLRLR